MGGLCRFTRRASLVASVVLAVSFAAVNLNAQSRQAPVQSQIRTDDNAAQQDIASFNRFLNDHPDVEKQLKANPYLINDPNFLSTQPALKAFLADHPQVRAQLQESPIDFVRRENSAGTAAPRNGSQNAGTLDGRDQGRMDEFLDEHRDIEQQLELNPGLINDSSYLAQHHDLQVFLSAHPQIRQEFAENPRYFTQRDPQSTNPPVGRAQENDSQRSSNAGVDSRDVGQMDQFLDVHQDLRWQLKQNPLLVNDSKYLAQHPELGLFLNAHPQIREEFSEHPDSFVETEKAAETPVADVNHANANAPPSNPNPAPSTATPPASNAASRPSNPNLELAKEERTRTDQFLDDHPNITKDLEKNPYLINQSNYLKHHKELVRFLGQHPEIQAKVAKDPTFFTQREWRTFEPAGTNRDQASTHSNPDSSNRELTEMDQFLAKHKKTAKELQKDPMLVTSQHYLDHNKDLRKFFEEHPQILVEFRQNPRNFMNREDELQAQLR
jgi:hypothetical protein